MANRKRKIAVCDLVTSFGGVQRVMANLLPKLAEQFDVCVVDPYANKEYAEKLNKANIRIYFGKPTFKKPFIGRQGTWKRPLYMLLAAPRLLRIRRMFAKAISEIVPDCIYANQLPTLRLLVTIRSLRKIPIVYHSHGYVGNSILNDASVRVINSRIGRVIPVSNSTADALRRAGVRADIIHMCYDAVPIEEIEHCARLPVSEPLPAKQPGQVVFVLPAAIQHTKGHHLAVNALARLIEKGHNCALWFAGDVVTGGVQRYLEELHTMAEKLGIAHLVHFLGWRDDIYQVINAADIVMLCSLTESESFGLGLAEGMVLSKPCIGANIGGMPEVILDKHTGLLFTPGSDGSLADVMALLATNTAMREKFGRAGRQRVEELFSVAAQAGRISTVINMTTN